MSSTDLMPHSEPKNRSLLKLLAGALAIVALLVGGYLVGSVAQGEQSTTVIHGTKVGFADEAELVREYPLQLVVRVTEGPFEFLETGGDDLPRDELEENAIPMETVTAIVEQVIVGDERLLETTVEIRQPSPKYVAMTDDPERLLDRLENGLAFYVIAREAERHDGVGALSDDAPYLIPAPWGNGVLDFDPSTDQVSLRGEGQAIRDLFEKSDADETLSDFTKAMFAS